MIGEPLCVFPADSGQTLELLYEPLVGSGDYKILEHLGLFGVDYFGSHFYRDSLVTAVDGHLDSSAACARGERGLLDLLLDAGHFLLHLLNFFHHIGTAALLGAGNSCFHVLFLRQLFLNAFIFFISPSSGSLPLGCSGAL